jgi:threonine dehydrogenase-like Zn-dependent dehydrogenase
MSRAITPCVSGYANEKHNGEYTQVKALYFDGTLRMIDLPVPQRGQDEVLVKVTSAGICNTDIEITRGYVPGFRGTPGHEFIGTVVESPDHALEGKRVTAEINCACGTCEFCRKDLGRHCPARTVLGIIRRNGVFAEYAVVPSVNVVPVPDSIPDDTAIFIEPLAAALAILDQVEITPCHDVLLIGDGKLAQLITMVLRTTGCNLTVLGKHPEKWSFLKQQEIAVVAADRFSPSLFDIVIEASGSPEAFSPGMLNVKPRGTFVLKSTYAGDLTFNPAPIVVNEITVVGSRCGVLRKSIDFLCRHTPDLCCLISGRFPLSRGLEALDRAVQPGVLKVVLDCST